MSKELKELVFGRLMAIKRDGMKDLVDYIKHKTDYYTAPASIKYHSNYEGGLLIHSHNVVEILKEKNERYDLGLSEESIFITGYLHDLCKCNLYKKDMKLRKNVNDRWEAYGLYVIDDEVPLGHGEKSVILIQQFIKLTLEESLMIRWHMGAYVSKEEQRDLHKAIEKYKSVLAIHIADQEASYMLESIEEPTVYTMDEYTEFKKLVKSV